MVNRRRFFFTMYGQNWRYKMKVFRLDLLFSSVPIFKANQYFRTKLLAGGKLPWWARASPRATSLHQRRCVSQGAMVECAIVTRRTTAMTGITTSQIVKSVLRSWSITSGMSGVGRGIRVNYDYQPIITMLHILVPFISHPSLLAQLW